MWRVYPNVFSPEYLRSTVSKSSTKGARGARIAADRHGKHVRDVKKAVLILVLFVDAAHQRSGGRQHLVDEYEDGLFGRELDALPDHIDELADRQVCGDEVLLLVDGRDIRFFDFLADDLFVEQAATG